MADKRSTQSIFPSRICLSLAEREAERMLALANAEAESGECFFEFCLETLDDPWMGPHVIERFLRRWPSACVLVTCRSGQDGFRGRIDEQLMLLERAIAAGARMIDLEIEQARNARQWMKDVGRHCTRVVSSHNFEACPPIEPILEELQSISAEIIKVCVATDDANTMMALMQTARQCKTRNIILAMGEAGAFTRIVGPVAGRSFTYASPAAHPASAPGQLCAKTLREVYRLEALNAETVFLPMKEQDAGHLAMRNRDLAHAGVNALYLPSPGSKRTF